MESSEFASMEIVEKYLNGADEPPTFSNKKSVVFKDNQGNSQNTLDFDSHTDFLETLSTFADAQQTLEINGKSFRFAQRFLGQKTGQAAAKLYQFCRVCDDLVDEAPTNEHANSRIYWLLRYLKIINRDSHTFSINNSIDIGNTDSTSLNKVDTKNDDNIQDLSYPAVLASFIELKKEYYLSDNAVHQLLEGMQSDLTEKVKVTEDDLLIYCYRAAGTVGELICPILGAPDVAKPYAIDLGVAMQLTNIARDVLEDAQNGRIYLPQEWLGRMTVKNILYPSPSQKMIICAAIKRCLVLAEDYYSSALQGLQYVPWKNRFAMHQALFIYREIGLVLAENDFDFQQGRVYVPTFDKLFLVFRHSYKLMFSPKIEPHQALLHDSFRSFYVQSPNP
jgi:phytoene synthase